MEELIQAIAVSIFTAVFCTGGQLVVLRRSKKIENINLRLTKSYLPIIREYNFRFRNENNDKAKTFFFLMVKNSEYLSTKIQEILIGYSPICIIKGYNWEINREIFSKIVEECESLCKKVHLPLPTYCDKNL